MSLGVDALGLIPLGAEAGANGPATHTTTGALTGPGAAVAGTAAHKTLHTTTGALTGPGAAVAGTAAHKTLHTTSGALTGPGSSVVGTATHPHTTSGVLAGPGAIVVGSADHTAAGGTHDTSGTLSGPGAAVAGTAAHLTLHTTTGVLVGPGTTVSGVASHLTLHTTSGVLAGPGAIIVGTAPHSASTIARPSTDTTPGGWLPSTGSDLYAMIDEVAADDADYIYATTATTCELALSPVTDPLTSSGQVVSYRAWSPTSNGLTVKLMQGVTTIATWTHATLPTTATTYNQALSASECDAITDYTALSLKFESTI